jgi:hypothetical protein
MSNLRFLAPQLNSTNARGIQDCAKPVRRPHNAEKFSLLACMNAHYPRTKNLAR